MSDNDDWGNIYFDKTKTCFFNPMVIAICDRIMVGLGSNIEFHVSILTPLKKLNTAVNSDIGYNGVELNLIKLRLL